MKVNTEKTGKAEQYSIDMFLELTKLQEETPVLTFSDRDGNEFLGYSAYKLLLYQIDIHDIVLRLSSSMGKAIHYIKAKLYRYDGVRVYISEEGEVTGIQNSAYLQTQWQAIKKIILQKYNMSDKIKHGIEAIEQEFQGEQSMLLQLMKYDYLGMLFSGIPVRHDNVFSMQRKVALDNIFCKEDIVYQQLQEDSKIYSITSSDIGNHSSLKQYEGSRVIMNKEILPQESTLAISYQKEDGHITMQLKLETI